MIIKAVARQYPERFRGCQVGTDTLTGLSKIQPIPSLFQAACVAADHAFSA